MCYRACKSDLAMESPRLWFWDNRLKLLLMVSLVTPSCYPCWRPITPLWCRTYFAAGVTQQESGTAKLRYPSPDCVPL